MDGLGGSGADLSPVAYSATGNSVPILEGVSKRTRRSSRRDGCGDRGGGRRELCRRAEHQRFDGADRLRGARRFVECKFVQLFRDGVFDGQRHRDATCVRALIAVSEDGSANGRPVGICLG
jgi:hypothetical protein